MADSAKKKMIERPYSARRGKFLMLEIAQTLMSAIIDAVKSYSPNLLSTYLYDLAQKYNTFYNKHKIIGDKKENFRVDLTNVTSLVLSKGLKLLGIQTPEKM